MSQADVEYICSALTPATAMSRFVCDLADAPLGASRLGGLPDVPVEFEWPVTSDYRPLGFLGQFDLAEFHASQGSEALPQTGRLLLFFDNSGTASSMLPGGGHRIALIHDTTPQAGLVRASLPEAMFPSLLAAHHAAMKETAAIFEKFGLPAPAPPPQPEVPKFAKVEAIGMRPVLTVDRLKLLSQLPDQHFYEAALSSEADCIKIFPPDWPTLRGQSAENAWADQCGGAPDIIQHTFDRDLNAASQGRIGARNRKDAVHVFTLMGESYLEDWPSDWGDGYLYIYMTRADISAGRWDRAVSFSQQD